MANYKIQFSQDYTRMQQLSVGYTQTANYYKAKLLKDDADYQLWVKYKDTQIDFTKITDEKILKELSPFIFDGNKIIKL